MAGRNTKLTPEVQETILAYIRAGAFEWVAAEAAGIGKSTYYRWMKLGEQQRSGVHHEFWRAVRQARAQVRVAVEAAVRTDQPFAWLRYGPGRERPGEPGWTDSRAITGADGGPMQVTFNIASSSGMNEEESSD